MRRVFTLVLTFAVAASAVAAAEKAKTAEDIDKAMKKVGTTQQAVNKAIQAMAYADAKKQVEIVKTTLSDAENFWKLNKKDDAVKFSQDTLGKLDVLDKALTEKTPDNAKVTALQGRGGQLHQLPSRVSRHRREQPVHHQARNDLGSRLAARAQSFRLRVQGRAHRIPTSPCRGLGFVVSGHRHAP